MKKKRRKFRELATVEAATLLLCTYLPGILMGIWFYVGCLLGRIKVLHKERIPENMENAILACNHPSVIDPLLAGCLLFRHFFCHPLRYAPLIMADRQNFYESKWLWLFRPVMMPIDRKSKEEQTLGLLKMNKTKRPRIIFPEAGRTFKGQPGQWLYCLGGNDSNGGRIRPFKSGVGVLAKSADFVVPVAIVGSHRLVPNSKFRLWTRFNFSEKITIVVGEPMKFGPEIERGEATQKIQIAVLNLIREAL